MGWSCARRLPGGRIAWCGLRKPKRCWKLVPGSVRQPSRRTMRPGWRSVRNENAQQGVAQVAAQRVRLCQDLVIMISTTLVRQALTFRHYLKQHTKRFVGKVQSSPKG